MDFCFYLTVYMEYPFNLRILILKVWKNSQPSSLRIYPLHHLHLDTQLAVKLLPINLYSYLFIPLYFSLLHLGELFSTIFQLTNFPLK